MHLLILGWFYSTKWFRIVHSNLSYLSKLKLHKNQKYAKSNFSLTLLNINRISVHDFTDHNEQVCSEFERALLFSVEELKQNALTIRPRRHFSNWNNGIYIDLRFNDVTTVWKIRIDWLNNFAIYSKNYKTACIKQTVYKKLKMENT